MPNKVRRTKKPLKEEDGGYCSSSDLVTQFVGTHFAFAQRGIAFLKAASKRS